MFMGSNDDDSSDDTSNDCGCGEGNSKRNLSGLYGGNQDDTSDDSESVETVTLTTTSTSVEIVTATTAADGFVKRNMKGFWGKKSTATPSTITCTTTSTVTEVPKTYCDPTTTSTPCEPEPTTSGCDDKKKRNLGMFLEVKLMILLM